MGSFSYPVPTRPKPTTRPHLKKNQLANQVQAHLVRNHLAPVPQVVKLTRLEKTRLVTSKILN